MPGPRRHRLRSSLAGLLLATATIALFTPVPGAAGAEPGIQAGQAAATEEVVIGTRIVAPFVIDEGDGSYSGLTIHLWEHIADELGLDYRFEERGIQGMLDGVVDGSLFASASALTVTAEREESVDFTHPFFVTGLGIAVGREPAGLGAAILALLSPDLAWVLILLVALLLSWGVLVWLFERHENQEEFGGSPAEGIGNGFWWAAVTMTTVGYGDKSPRTVGGRVVGFVWMFTAIIVISFFTASIASSLTVTQLDTRVSGPRDLPHVRVGGLAGSAAVLHLEGDGIRAIPFPTIHDGLEALASDELDAFVHDAPILRYYQQEDFPDRVLVLPGTFVEQYYGIALPLDSPERNAINRVLLDYLAGEEWERLNRRYLGGEG
jgi:polar amino acid transport system substrate-binding protein